MFSRVTISELYITGADGKKELVTIDRNQFLYMLNQANARFSSVLIAGEPLLHGELPDSSKTLLFSEEEMKEISLMAWGEDPANVKKVWPRCFHNEDLIRVLERQEEAKSRAPYHGAHFELKDGEDEPMLVERPYDPFRDEEKSMSSLGWAWYMSVCSFFVSYMQRKIESCLPPPKNS